MKLRDAVATWWLRQASIRHGHVPPIGAVSVPEGARGLGAVAGVLLAALTGGGLAWLLPAIGALFGTAASSPPTMSAPPTVNDAPAPVWVAPAEPAARDGSLYQYLEDRGDHLPQ